MQPRPDAILIESTGLADPAPVAQTFMADPILARIARLERVITLADAVHLSRQIDRSPEAARQLAFADCVMLTRADQCSEATLAQAVNLVTAINPGALLRIIQGGTDDLAALHAPLDRQNLPAEHHPADCGCGAHDHAHHRSDVGTLSLRGGELEHRRFFAWVQAITATDSARIWRMKGILAFTGDPARYHLQGVHMLLEGSSGPLWGAQEARESRLVVIGQSLDAERLRAGWESCAQDFDLIPA